MAAKRKTIRCRQLDLFQPQPRIPRWQNLSPEVQRQTLSLLARLLRGVFLAPQAVARREEAGDE